MKRLYFPLLLLATVCLAACDGNRNEESQHSKAKPQEQAQPQAAKIEPPSRQNSSQPQKQDHGGLPVRIQLYNESAYVNADDTLMIDVIEGQLAFIEVMLIDDQDIPLRDTQLEIKSSQGSPLVGADRATDVNGVMQFAVRPAKQGEDRVTVSWNSIEEQVILNVISDEATQWQDIDKREGLVKWETLLGSRLTYLDDAIRIDFTKEVQALNGQEIKVAGFMMPLESEAAQTNFLLVSTPPSCFFHLPGGPTGAIEVFAPKGIEMSWDPMVIKGRFELFQPTEYGVVYRMHDAVLER
ncbi:MAG: DUF3299 domain-containing protein [Salinisphaeraceae bacterium]|nr:DUF3299 domain-containing protein [Salinisphaeraceae bacterium]